MNIFVCVPMVPMGLFIALCSSLPSSEVSCCFNFYYSFPFSEDKSYLRSVSIVMPLFLLLFSMSSFFCSMFYF